MKTQDRILAWARGHSPFKSPELVRHLGIARQNVAAHLGRLVDSGKLTKTGSTKNATYSFATSGKSKGPKQSKILLYKKLNGLEEDRVFAEVDRRLNLRRALSRNGYTVASYAFTEMLNNAIDHSRSRRARIEVFVGRRDFSFEVRDFGIGIFKKVRTKFKLASEFDALEHVFKGKQTTDPKHHSGEGIFFTSRIADRIELSSHQLSATVDNELQDTFIQERRFLSGTSVRFHIKSHTKKSLSALFDEFTNSQFLFDKNTVNVKLSREGGLLSRSQAKRLLVGMEKYTRLTLNFAGVKDLGQGFADEVFRVFQQAHPKIKIEFTNATSVVERMIRRVTQK